MVQESLEPAEDGRSQLKKDVLQVRPEQELRSLILKRLQLLSLQQWAMVENIFLNAYPGLDLNKLADAVAMAISQAQRGNTWNNDHHNIVHFAYYATDEIFFTVLLHEVGHSVLGRLGKVESMSRSEIDAEEQFCWQFSELICRLLELGYSIERQVLYQRLLLAINQLSADPTAHELFELLEVERQIYGVSFYDFDRLSWSADGRPVLIDAPQA